MIAEQAFKRRAFPKNKDGHYGKRNQPVVVARNILRGGDSRRGLGDAAKRSRRRRLMYGIENFLVRILYMQALGLERYMASLKITAKIDSQTANAVAICEN
jgi:hypothetical protein